MTDNIFKSLRRLRVLVIHQEDREGEVLLQQLARIGCQVDALWPLPSALPPTADVVFLNVQQDSLPEVRRLCKDDRDLRPTLVCMVDYENPTILQAVIDIGADAVITRPIRPFGVMTNLVIARQTWLRENKHREKVKKLERKMRGLRKLNQAKAIMMNSRGISEDVAYKLIREQAMVKRVTTEEIATAIINANELLKSSDHSD